MGVSTKKLLENVIIVITFTLQCSGFEFVGSTYSMFSKNLKGSFRMRAFQHFYQPPCIFRLRASLGLKMVDKSAAGRVHLLDRSVMDVGNGGNSLDRRRLLLQSAICIASLALVAPGSAVGEGLASRLRYTGVCR